MASLFRRPSSGVQVCVRACVSMCLCHVMAVQQRGKENRRHFSPHPAPPHLPTEINAAVAFREMLELLPGVSFTAACVVTTHSKARRPAGVCLDTTTWGKCLKVATHTHTCVHCKTDTRTFTTVFVVVPHSRRHRARLSTAERMSKLLSSTFQMAEARPAARHLVQSRSESEQWKDPNFLFHQVQSQAKQISSGGGQNSDFPGGREGLIRRDTKWGGRCLLKMF